MSSSPPPGGADLARQILRQAREDALKRGTSTRRKDAAARRRRAPRGDGRDPVQFGGVLETLAAAYGWARPSAGGQVMAAWPQLLGDDAGRAVPERFDAESRTLHLRPASPAAATWARLNTPRLLQHLNAHAGQGSIAALRILTPGPAPTAVPAAGGVGQPIPGPQPGAARPEPATPRPAPAGYLQARAAAAETRTISAVPEPAFMRYVADVQFTYREPETAFTPAQDLEPPTAGTGTGPGAGSEGINPETIRQAAIKAARTARVNDLPEAPRLFPRTA